MNPLSAFFLLLIVMPIVEIYFLIQVGSSIGALSTVMLIVFTAVVGAFLFRLQGLTTIQRVQASLARGEIPAIEMIEGAMLLVSGALLLTPGFVTDIVGFVCLIPGLRRKFALSLMDSQFVNQSSFQANASFQHTEHEQSIDGDILKVNSSVPTIKPPLKKMIRVFS